MKKFLSLLLAVIMVIGIFPMNAMALELETAGEAAAVSQEIQPLATEDAAEIYNYTKDASGMAPAPSPQYICVVGKITLSGASVKEYTVTQTSGSPAFNFTVDVVLAEGTAMDAVLTTKAVVDGTPQAMSAGMLTASGDGEVKLSEGKATQTISAKNAQTTSTATWNINFTVEESETAPTVPFTYTIDDVPANGDNWAKLGNGTISGEAGGVIKHIWDGNNITVLLTENTPDDAVITSSFSISGMRPSLSGAGDVTLVDGTATQTIKLSSPFGTVGTWTILYTKDKAPVLAEGQSAESAGETIANESYAISLENVFYDEDGDALSYQVKVNDGAYENIEGSSYTYSTAAAGEHKITFRAYDGILYSDDTYTVTLTVKNSSVTYDVSVVVPEGVSPKFYAVSTVDGDTAVKGEELVYENGTVKVPENVTRIIWEADGLIGMSVPVSSGAKVELVKVTFEAKLYSGEADTEATIEIKDSEGVKITGTAADTYLLPTASGFTYKATAGSANSANYHPAELTEQTPAEGKVEIKLTLIHFTVIAPKGSVVSAGTTVGSFRYTFSEPLAIETEDENVIYRFAPLTAPTGGGAFIRVQRPDDPDAVTYWDYKSSKKEGETITVTADMLFMNDSGDDKFDSTTVYRNFEKYEMDLGDIYMNINNQGYINLNVGDSKGLNMFRNWQAINSYINDKISLPDFEYEIVTIEGENVISITPDKYNSASATLTATGEGTAIVLVTYNAMYSDSTAKNSNGDAGDGNRFSAIWPDRTGVFVVSVGKDGTAIKSNMTCNGAVFDAEHSPQFYVGDKGANVSFTPEEGVTVTVNRSTVGTETLSFGEFTNEGVSVNSETGEVTVSGLKTGRHIIKLEKGGVASYQVVTAQQVTVEFISSDGRSLGDNPTVAPGSSLTLKIKGLTNPAEKFATKYNFNAQVTYKDEKGNAYKNSSGAAYGKYNFSSQEQIVNVTIPADWDGETMTLNGYIQMGGFAGGAIGDHRKVSYGNASGMATGSGAGMVLGTLPELVINVGTIPATSLTLDKTNIRIEADEQETITAIVTPENSTDLVEWSSSDETIATVENGVVTGQSAGTATITAKAGELTATCVVEVYGTKKEINIETGASGKRYLSNIKITGVRGVVETAEDKAYTILLDCRTKTTDTINFEMTVNSPGSLYYFWVNSSKLKTRNNNPGTISIVPEWNENNEAVVTVRLANSSGRTNYDSYTITFKFAEHVFDREVADEKYFASEATCTEKATYYKSCKCGEIGTETFEYGEALGHDEVSHEAKEPTCTEIGWDAYVTCSRCDYTTYAEKAALGHDEVSHEAKEPTCTEIGWDEYVTCSRCDYSTYVEKAALGHDEISHEAKEPTCTEIGWDSYVTCSRCDYTTYVEKAALGHDEVSHEAKEPTCTEIGWDEYVTCSRCDYTTYVEKAALGHDWKDATCTEPRTCEVCGVTEGEALGHSYGDWVTVEAPTETEGGRKVKTCSACGHQTSKYVKPLSEDGITVITHGGKTEDESNPNTGAPANCGSALCAMAVLAGMAIVLKKINKQ